ncbi:MAG TPA: ABC transporter permease, partial [Candidatus Methylacidiphilales bacterium]|nr:ABC transporter permease [Candidatus Methylacidiphilales bacterium]
MSTLLRFYRVVRRDWLLSLCAIILVMIVLVSVLGIYFTGYDYQAISNDSLQPPSFAHWCGTDLHGRDLLTRALYGAQISLKIAAFATLVSLIVGVTYGMVSGYAGGRVDNFMMRLIEIVYSLPTLILVIVLVATLENSVIALLKALGLSSISPRFVLLFVFIGLTEWLTMARIIRGQVLVLKQQPFVHASLALGQSHARILFKHLLPNLSGIILVYLTLTVPQVMLDESFLSFLGLGVQAPDASWGTLISEAVALLNP